MALRLRSHGWLLGVLAVATFAMLFRLDAQPIQNWDEGIHGAVSLEMVEDGDWLTPHYMGGPYFRKPPLKLWMSSALFEWFGANAWTLRLPSALAGIATSLLVAWWMWQWRRNRLDAFLAGAIVATMRPIFFHGFRTGEMDGTLTLFTTAALYCWWRATRAAAHHAGSEFLISNSKFLNKSQIQMTEWFALVGVCVGLAVMTKSAAGLLPLPIIAADYLLHRRWRTIPIRFLILASCLLLLVAAPWHIIMTVLHGAAFWQDYLGWHVVKRATQALHNEAAGTWWYVGAFARRFTPYTFMFVPALLCALFFWIRNTTRQRGANLLETTSAEASCQLPEAQRGEPHEPTWQWANRRGITHASEAQRPTPERRSPKGDRDQQLARDHCTIPFLLIWFLLGFALFTFIKTKLDWYLLPLYPAAAMLIVWFLAEIRAALRGRVTHIAYVIALVLLFGTGSAVTARHLWRTDPPNPFTDIAAAIRGSSGVLVGYALDYKQHPAGYFILRNALRNDVRILDGQSDVARTISMLRERERGLLLVQNGTEFPEELRAAIREPQTFGGFTLWQRR